MNSAVELSFPTGCMDPELQRALFEDTSEFEELDDDFLAQASAPIVDDASVHFDYDAHIARLIAASERHTGIHHDDHLSEEEDEFDSVQQDVVFDEVWLSINVASPIDARLDG